MNTKIKLFFIASVLFISFIKSMDVDKPKANELLALAASSNDYAGAIQAIQLGGELNSLQHRTYQDFILELLENRAFRYLKIKENDILSQLNKFFEKVIEKNTGLIPDLANIVLEYENPFPKDLYGLNSLSNKQIDELIHFYKKHKTEKHHCVIM